MTELEQQVVDHCRKQSSAMLALLERLVRQSSHTPDRAGTSAAAEMLATELAATPGMAVERIQSEEYGTHVLAHNATARDSANACVALLGHHDTVFPSGSFEGFVVEGDIARGPGVLDMKSGLVIVVFALRALAAAGLLERVPLRVLSVSDEEVGSPESTALIEEHLREASCCLVFEAGRQADAIITARKGTGKILATAQGRAAHAGNHHAEGVNAIVAMARLIEATQALTDYERGVTINAGTIHGGQGRNVVPDHCEALFDMRFVSMADGKWLEERFTQAALEAAASVPGSSIELQGGVARPPLERCEANVALFEEYASCAKAAGLGHGEAALIGGGSDASTIAAIGVPAIDGLGPRGSGFHTKDELIEVPTLLQRLEALARFLVRRGAMLIITTLLLGAGVVACAGDHSGLAKGDTTASGGATGSGGAATTSSKTTSSSSIVEPSGPTKLTIVNGAVDYEAVRLCFVPYPAGATGSELPWPGSVEGLPFARASVVDNIEQIVPASTDVQVVVVAGNLSQTGGKSCSSLIATPPSGVEQRSVGVLPESVFSEDKSLLLVTYGCIGGADHSHEAQASVCGASYASDAPTVGLAAGFMSRLVQEGKASIQLVHAVVAMEQVAIRFVPGVDDATHYLIENEWSLGAISPFPPYSKLPAADWGKVAEAQLEIYLPNQGSPQVVTALSEVLANSTLNADAVVDGKGLVFVAVGAGPGVEEGPWWKPLTYTMVQADP